MQRASRKSKGRLSGAGSKRDGKGRKETRCRKSHRGRGCAEDTEKKKKEGHDVSCPYEEKIYERKRTDSRWNILMAMKRATAA